MPSTEKTDDRTVHDVISHVLDNLGQQMAAIPLGSGTEYKIIYHVGKAQIVKNSFVACEMVVLYRFIGREPCFGLSPDEWAKVAHKLVKYAESGALQCPAPKP